MLQAARRPTLRRAPRGLEGLGALRLLEVAKGLWAVVADAPRARFDAAAIEPRLRDLDWVGEQATAHEAVVEHFMEKAAIVPLRLFTLYTGDERVTSALALREDELREVLERTRGRREWSFKVILDPVRARAAARAGAADPADVPASGSAFLARKKRERDAASDAVQRALDEVGVASEELLDASGDPGYSSAAPLPDAASPSLLADVTYLVQRSRERRFRKVADAACARLGALGCEARVTGPWPPYEETRNITGGGR